MTASDHDTGADALPQPILPTEALALARRLVASALESARTIWAHAEALSDEEVVAHAVIEELIEALTILRMLEGGRG